MNIDNKSNHPRMGKGIKTPPQKSSIGDELASEKIKLLQYMFGTLCTVRMTAKSYDYGFLSYLVEMAAMEVQREIKEAKRDRPQMPAASNEQFTAPNIALKAS